MTKKIFTHPLILIITLPLGIWLWTLGGTAMAWGISTHFCAFAFCYWSLLVLLKIKLGVPKIFFLFGALLLGFLGIFTLSTYRPFWSGPTLVHLAEVIIGLGYLLEFFLVKGQEKLSRKILLLIVAGVILAAALFAFYWFWGKQEVWPTYDNARYEFSLEYPAGWQLGEAPTNNDGRTFTSPDQKIECRAYGFYNALSSAEGNPQTLEEFVNWLVADEALGEEVPVVLARKETTLGGNPALELITQEGQNIQQAVYALGQESGRAVVCTFPNPAVQKSFAQDFNRMVRTFQCRTNLDGASAEEEAISGTEECVNLINGVIVPFKDLQIFTDTNYPEVTLTERAAWDQQRLPAQVLDLEAKDYDCYPMPAEFGETPNEPGIQAEAEVTKVEWKCGLEYQEWEYLDPNALDLKADFEGKGYTCRQEDCFLDGAQFGYVWLCAR